MSEFQPPANEVVIRRQVEQSAGRCHDKSARGGLMSVLLMNNITRGAVDLLMLYVWQYCHWVWRCLGGEKEREYRFTLICLA